MLVDPSNAVARGNPRATVLGAVGQKLDPEDFAQKLTKNASKPSSVRLFEEHVHSMRRWLQQDGVALEKTSPMARRPMSITRAMVEIANEHEESRYSLLSSDIFVERVIEYHNNKLRFAKYHVRKMEQRNYQPQDEEEVTYILYIVQNQCFLTLPIQSNRLSLYIGSCITDRSHRRKQRKSY